jgi:phosphoribosylamine--glycine ligase
MITDEGPKVIEFNVRLGDPEAQVVLPLLDQPLGELMLAAAEERLPGTGDRDPGTGSREAGTEVAVGVVLATSGYPGEVRLGDQIGGLDALARDCPDVLTFFAGVKARDHSLITSGGRVMTIVSREATFERAIANTYEALSHVRFEGMQYRRDIGRKALST